MTNKILRPREILPLLKAHADKHYEEDGWDVFVECYTDEERLKMIGRCFTLAGAIKKIGKDLKDYDDHRKEIQATTF